MKPLFLPLSKVDQQIVNVSGVEVLTIVVTRCLRPLEERIWGRDSSRKVFIFEKTRRGLEDVTLRDKGLPQYVGIVPMVQQMQLGSTGR